jgi:uncharacterized protein YlxW (UPF0749 family)
MGCTVKLTQGGPLIARGTLAAWEREQRARLAIAEEEAELGQMQAELGQLRAQVATLQAEIEALNRSMKTAQHVLSGLQGSRGYRVLRRIGRWESVERGMRRVLT